IIKTFRQYKTLGERALAQTPDAHLNTQIDAESNSIAMTVKHVGGNLRSRYRDYLTSDGEKPDRDRDTEFEIPQPAARDEIMKWGNEGGEPARAASEAPPPADLDRTITIRGTPHTVLQALNRSVTHTAYHVGQIAYLAKHFAGAEWTSLTIPKRRPGSS